MTSKAPDNLATIRKRSGIGLPAQMVVLTLVVRVWLFGIVWLSLKSLPPEWTAAGSQILQAWSMWDGGHYVAIAEHGYTDAAALQDRAAFFPLYPLLMRMVAWLPGVSIQLAGILISLGSIALVTWFLADYLNRQFGESVTRNTIVVLLVTPYAVFLTAVYTESQFMLLAILSLWFADRKQWWAAAIVCGLATATRVTGLALVPTVLWLAYRHRQSLSRLFGLAAISVSGIVAYVTYTWIELDSPFAFLRAQSDWGGWHHRFGGFLEVFFTRPGEIITGNHVNAIALLNFVMLIGALASVPLMWRRLDTGMAMYSTLVIAQGALSIISFGRMMIPAFGVHIVIALLVSGDGWKASLRQAAVVASASIMTLLTVLYAQGKWVI
jgi:hypothetical protein